MCLRILYSGIVQNVRIMQQYTAEYYLGSFDSKWGALLPI